MSQNSLSAHSNRFAALTGASLLLTAAANLAPLLASGLAVQIQADLDFGETELGLTVSAFFAVGALGSALSGLIVERVGPTGALRSAGLTAGVILLGASLAARSWLLLTVFVAAAGIANAWAQPASNLYIARGIPVQRHGLAIGIQKSGIPTASLLGGLAVPTLGVTVGWRWAFVAGGVMSLVVAMFVPSVNGHRDRPQGRSTHPQEPDGRSSATVDDAYTPSASPTLAAHIHTHHDDETGAPPHAGSPHGTQSQHPQKPEAQQEGRPEAGEQATQPKPEMALRRLVFVSFSTGLAAVGSAALGAFFVLSGVEYGIAETTAGLLLVVGSLVGIASRLVFGAGADRVPVSAWRILTGMYTVAALGFLGFATGSNTMLLVAMPFAFATSFAWPGISHLAIVRANPSAPSAATGVIMTGSFTGAVCGPLLFGVIAEQAGYAWAWSSMAVVNAVAAMVMVVASRGLGAGVPRR